MNVGIPNPALTPNERGSADVIELQLDVFGVDLPRNEPRPFSNWRSIVIALALILVGLPAGLGVMAAMIATPSGGAVCVGSLCPILFALVVWSHRSNTRERRALVARITAARERIAAGTARADALASLFPPHKPRLFTPSRLVLLRGASAVLRQLASLLPPGAILLAPWPHREARFKPLTEPFEPIPLTRAGALLGASAPRDFWRNPPLLDRFSWERRSKRKRWIARVVLLVGIIEIVGVLSIMVGGLLQTVISGRLPPLGTPERTIAAIFSTLFVVLLVLLLRVRRWHLIPGGIVELPPALRILRSRDAMRIFTRDDSVLLRWGQFTYLVRSDGAILEGNLRMSRRDAEAMLRAWLSTAKRPSDELLMSWFGEDAAREPVRDFGSRPPSDAIDAVTTGRRTVGGEGAQ